MSGFTTSIALAAFFFVASASAASAAPILVTVDFDGNACSGIFGQGFENCDVGNALTPPVEISPIIMKNEYDDGNFQGTEINSAFPTVDGTEFSISPSNPNASGTWSYFQGTGDPDVRYWVAKSANGFRLHWMVDGPVLPAVCGTAYSAECLNLALAVTSGSWATPTGQALSNFSWYDSAATIPEPSVMILLGGGALVVALKRRRRWS